MTFTHNIILVLFFCVTNTWAHGHVDLVSNNLNEGDHGVKLLNNNDVYLSLFKNIPPGAEKVHLQLYYEVFCPYCIKFDVHQFAPVVSRLGSHLNIQTYPFGNAKFINNTGKLDIKCQHGPKECYGNKLHACALDKLENTTALLYNACLMNSTSSLGSDDESADRCGKLMNTDSEPIKECAKGARGMELLVHYGIDSYRAHFSHVPYVLIDGMVYDLKDNNLMTAVCAAFTNPPPPCTKSEMY